MVMKKPAAPLPCDIRANFAKALRTWRRKNNLSLKEIAAEMGISLATVSAWERGARFPAVQHFQALVNYTGIPPCRLFCVMADKCVPAECLLAMRNQAAPSR
jgi:transcriptional regulator with XRE-family HTH domain